MTQDLVIAGKTLLASNLTQACMLGGYAVTSVDPRTGEQEYTPYRHSMTWLNIVYGKKWKPGIFVGYLKNLGTGKTIAGPTYGVGLRWIRCLLPTSNSLIICPTGSWEWNTVLLLPGMEI